MSYNINELKQSDSLVKPKSCCFFYEAKICDTQYEPKISYLKKKRSNTKVLKLLLCIIMTFYFLQNSKKL